MKTKGAIYNGQSRETVNIGYTRHKTKINARENRKEQSIMDNPEKLETLGTQDTGRRQTNKKKKKKSITQN